MKKIQIGAAALSMMLLCSCQPTPDHSVVVSKQDDITAKASASTSADQLSDIPETLTEEERILSDRLSVTIDADILLPESGQLPMARLSMQGIQQETAEQWLSALADGRDIYYQRSLSDLSVQELTAVIEHMETTGSIPVRAALMDELPYESMEQALAFAREKLGTAPAEAKYQYIHPGDAVLGKCLEFDSEYEVCTAEIANGYCGLRYRCYDLQYNDGLVTPLSASDSCGGITVSFEDAVSQAEQLLTQMGMQDFTLNAAGWIPDADRYTDAVQSYEDWPKCYALYFTKQIGGMNETYVDPTYAQIANREESYQPVWEPEYIEVHVDDDGIAAVIIPEYPSKVEILEENVAILPFEDIIERFYEQIKVSGCWVDEAEEDIIEKRTVYLDEIVLGGMRTIEKDADTYLYTPVWSFMGSVVTKYRDSMGDPNQLNENNEFTNRDYRQCLLTISAIDGRVISRSQGY